MGTMHLTTVFAVLALGALGVLADESCPLHVDTDAAGCRSGADMVGRESVLDSNLSKQEQLAQCSQLCCDQTECDSWAVHEQYSASWTQNCVNQDCCLLKTAGWQLQDKTAQLGNAQCTSGGKKPVWKGVDCNGKTYSGGNGVGLAPCQPSSRPSICPWNREAPYTSLSGGGCSSDVQVDWTAGDVCDLNTCNIDWKGTKCGSKRYAKWSGLKCFDTAGWANGIVYGTFEEKNSKAGASGWTCNQYASNGWCANGAAVSGFEWTLGTEYNSPEDNCCVCGSQVGVEATEQQSPCLPNGTSAFCNASSPYTSLLTAACSSDESAPWAGDVCDTSTCLKDWRGVDCNNKLYTGGNGQGLSPCRTNGRPSLCPWDGSAPYTSLLFGGCSSDHSVNWPGYVCDLSTCESDDPQANDPQLSHERRRRRYSY